MVSEKLTLARLVCTPPTPKKGTIWKVLLPFCQKL